MMGLRASPVRVRGAADLLRPYRLRAGAAMAAIALATIATPAPPYLAGRAVDVVINKGSTEQLDEIVLLMVGALVLGWLAVYAQDLPDRVGRPARAAGPAHPPLRPPPDALDQLDRALASLRPADLDRLDRTRRRLRRLPGHRRRPDARHRRLVHRRPTPRALAPARHRRALHALPARERGTRPELRAARSKARGDRAQGRAGAA
jgi:hypothetical protein